MTMFPFHQVPKTFMHFYNHKSRVKVSQCLNKFASQLKQGDKVVNLNKSKKTF